MTKRGTFVLVAVAFAASVAGSAAGGTSGIVGQGYIACLAAVPVTTLHCDLVQSNDHEFDLPVGEVERVTLTATWMATNPTAEYLTLWINGDESCEVSEGPDCYFAYARGESPLTVELEGEAASNVTLEGVLYTAFCETQGSGGTVAFIEDQLDCEFPRVQLVYDQPFQYTWTIET